MVSALVRMARRKDGSDNSPAGTAGLGGAYNAAVAITAGYRSGSARSRT